MPHITVEYSDHIAASLDFPEMLSALHADLADKETIDINAIKTRARASEFSIVGDGRSASGFVHITLRLLPGRSEILRAEMAKSLFETAKGYIEAGQIALSVEIVELEGATYQK